ncbi:MAG: MarR family winged helix-turn-helix transcriptional regulator [Gemmatimonadaceae bacterium]
MSAKSAPSSTVGQARTPSAPAAVAQRVIQTRNAEDPALRAWIVLARAYHTIVRAVSRDVSRHRLTLGQFAVMEALYHKGALPLGKVGSLLLVTAGNITYVVDQLERRGLVRRERRHGDRRVVYAALTAKGRALIDDIFPSHARYIAELFDTLPPDEQAQLRTLLKKLGFAVAALEEHGADD